MADHLPLELERFLPYRLSILSNRVSQQIAREYQDRFDLSMTEWRVMAVLARYDADGDCDRPDALFADGFDA